MAITTFRDNNSTESTEAETYAGHIAYFNELLTDDTVGDIMINRFDCVFIEKKGVLSQLPFSFESREATLALARYIMKLCGSTEFDGQYFDGMLPDGSRVAIVLPPAAVDGISIAIRKRSKTMMTLDDMVAQEILPKNVADFLKALAKVRVTILVAGATSAGKTTLLNAMSAYIQPAERIITIEDTAELALQHHNVVRLEANDENKGISQRELVKSALRLRADRIIIGEIRGEESLDFMQAINSGHHGSMGTIHANNPRDAFMRLELMINMSSPNLSARFIYRQIASSLNVIIQAQRDESGRRYISHITELIGLEGETIVSQDLFVGGPDAKTGKITYKWCNFSSRNPKIQEAITMAKLIGKQ